MNEFFTTLSQWLVPILLLIILGAGVYKKIPMYEVFIQGALDGIKTTVKITPYIMAVFVAVGVFRVSGALDILLALFQPIFSILRIPTDLLTLGLLKPLSGSAALGITADLLHKYGPDSVVGIIASIAQGSSETTLYVLALYLGAVQIRESRHLLFMGLCSEMTAFILAIILGRLIT